MKKLLFLMFLVTVCSAVVTEQEVAVDKPHVVGKWASNASCVAIHPRWIATTRHQGGGVGTRVYFDGQPYTVLEIIIPDPKADLRICRIDGALQEYASIYQPVMPAVRHCRNPTW